MGKTRPDTGTPATDSVPPLIAVAGAAQATPGERKVAYRLGRAIAAAGGVLVCGGLTGVMSEACRGARELGGITVGLLPGGDPGTANPWVSIPLATGLGEARNVLVARSGRALLTVGGSWGTLSEIALARKLLIPVAIVGERGLCGADLPFFQDPSEAVTWALEQGLVEGGPRRESPEPEFGP